jgi:hypothetical protein
MPGLYARSVSFYASQTLLNFALSGCRMGQKLGARVSDIYQRNDNQGRIMVEKLEHFQSPWCIILGERSNDLTAKQRVV